MSMSLLAGGTMRMLHPGILEHWCEGCVAIHAIDVHAQSRDGKVIGWDGDEHYPSFGEPIRHERDGAVCEYLLRGGVLQYLQSTTHALAGQSRRLTEFPR